MPVGEQASVCESESDDDIVQVRRHKPGNCRVEMRVQAADADGAVLPTTDLISAIVLYTTVCWHSSYPWSITQSIRRFGSVVVPYDGEGNSFVGLLKVAVKTAREWGMGHRYLGMIQRHDHEMDRPENYDYLLALCRSEIPKSEACEGCRTAPQTRSKKIKIPETAGINILYPHVGVCRSFRIFLTVLRVYGPILRHSCDLLVQ